MDLKESLGSLLTKIKEKGKDSELNCLGPQLILIIINYPHIKKCCLALIYMTL